MAHEGTTSSIAGSVSQNAESGLANFASSGMRFDVDGEWTVAGLRRGRAYSPKWCKDIGPEPRFSGIHQFFRELSWRRICPVSR